MKVLWFFVFDILFIMLYPHILLSSSEQNSKCSDYSIDSAYQGEWMLQVGEEIEYSVHYSFFNIGTIRFKVTDKENRGGKTVYHACAFMDSSPSLKWLNVADLHVRFFSEIDQDAFSYGWISEDSASKKVTYRKMVFDYKNRKMYYEWGDKLDTGERKPIGKDTINIMGECQDGLSLFYNARAHVREKRQATISTFIDTSNVTTNINYGVENLSEEIDAVDYPIDVVKLNGHANFVGVFGLTGGFEGVFSNDIAGIPITARMKVIIGSVRVELIKWKRGDWMPPNTIIHK